MARLIVIAGMMLSLGFLGCMGDGDGDGGDDGGGGGTEEVTPDEDVVGGDEDVPVTPGDDVADDDTAGGCTNECTALNAQECVGAASFHVCSPVETCLAWGAETACPPGETCNAATGQCEGAQQCNDTCDAIGGKTCKGEATVAECQADQDGCKSYVTIEECADDKVCENGACTGGGGGGGDCAEIILCQADCGQNQTCAEGCVTSGTQDGQAVYMTMAQCIQGACSAFRNNPGAFNQCMVDDCGDSWAACVGGWGTKGCQQVMMCAQGCGADGGCQFECIFEGSQAGQSQLWAVQGCLAENCSHCGNDQNCFQTCAQDSCAAEVGACQ
mgnify:CR=1 FL=1